MKRTYLVSIFLFLSTVVEAQVYSFTPKIWFTSMYMPDTKNISLSYRIDTIKTLEK